MLLRFKKDAATGRSARIWRITKGVLRSETGKLRVTMYTKGIKQHSMLLHDVPAVDAIVRRWTADGVLVIGVPV
jgi:hypothetical protein